MALPGELDDLITEAARRIASISAGSGFAYLTTAAQIFQDIGEQIARLIYARDRSTPRLIACKKGCSFCCRIPSSARPSHPTGRTKDIYRMSVLDMITLIEKYPEVKHVIGNDISKIILSTLETASQTMTPQRCPFLNSDHACNIYEFRPVVCKIWFSTDAEICRYNIENEYSKENELTSESTDLRVALEQPFKTALSKRFPELEFGYYDFLKTLAFIADYDAKGNMERLRWNFDTDVPGRLIGRLLVRDSNK